MSTGGLIGGAAAGAAVGGVFGAVVGAVGGALLFSVMSPKAPKIPVQRIGELAQQTAKEGEPRPIVWGRVRPISGNIMHSSAPRIITREVQGQSTSGGGKGGKKKQPKQYEERVFRTYAIRICEGPITAIIRVWRNNKLVYDARGNAWGAQNNGVFLSRARFYLGAWTQMPDPTLESQWGAGNVPAYRGTCYMVVPDEDLTELGGAIPQYIYEVERAEGVALTSLLYNAECIEDAESTGAVLLPGGPVVVDSAESSGIDLMSGELRQTLKDYSDWPHEPTESLGIELVSGELRQAIKSYTDWPAESSESNGIELMSGELRVALIKYEKWPVESTESTGIELIGGTLT